MTIDSAPRSLASLGKNELSYEELIQCAKGFLLGEGNPQLPLPPMLMFDRITSITETGGASNRGAIEAELDIKPSAWFFECHFQGDPVMPGCLGLDALWQLLGFYLGWLGGLGRGRALGVNEIKFTEQVLPTASRVTYLLDIKRVIRKKITMGVADGRVLVDGKLAYTALGLKVALMAPESA